MRKIDLLQRAVERLSQVEIDDPVAEARLLLCWAVGCDRLGLMGLSDIAPDVSERFLAAIERRSQLEPVAFITGEQGFWTLDLYVSPATLIPRADSETLIEALLEQKPRTSHVRSILDLGTGTGCLLLAALQEYQQAHGIGVDIAWEAASLARRNATRHSLLERADFLVGSWAEPITGRFDIVLSNPPYIEHHDMSGLMRDVVEYEPHRALDGGEDGLDAYRILCETLPRLLTAQGCAILELGIGQEEAVTALAEAQGLKKLDCRKDLSGIPRALVLGFA